jgi:hypothetical protein
MGSGGGSVGGTSGGSSSGDGSPGRSGGGPSKINSFSIYPDNATGGPHSHRLAGLGAWWNVRAGA